MKPLCKNKDQNFRMREELLILHGKSKNGVDEVLQSLYKNEDYPMYGYIYLIREREFLLRNEDVYKLGGTIQKVPNLQIRRLKEYKKGSQLLTVCICDYKNVFDVEEKLKKIFNEKFKKHLDGTEYFIGNPTVMANIIYENMIMYGKLNNINDSTFKNNQLCVPKNISYNQIKYLLKANQPHNEMRLYLKMTLASLMTNPSKEGFFYIFVGTGIEGMHKLMDLLRITLGKKVISIQNNILSNNRSSFLKSQSFIDAQICIMDGINASDEINASLIRTFVYEMSIRKKKSSFEKNIHAIMLCRSLPEMECSKSDIWEKLKIIPFNSKFINESEASTKIINRDVLEPNMFYINIKIPDQNLRHEETFGKLLMKYYDKYKINGLIIPESVINEMQIYRDKCDTFVEFINFISEKTNNAKHNIPVRKLSDKMKLWYTNIRKQKEPSITDFRKFIQQRMPNEYDKVADLLICYSFRVLDFKSECKLADTWSNMRNMNY